MKDFLAAVLFLSLATANAQVFRCTSAGGQVAYSDAPCAPGTAGSQLVAPKALPDALALQRENERLHLQLLEDENRRLKAEIAAARAASTNVAVAPAVGRTAADVQADRADSFECRQARRDYEFALSSISARTAPAARMAVYSACGLQPPAETTVEVHGRRAASCVRAGTVFQCR